MRILIYSPTMSSYGGIETHLVNMACLLSERGWHVELLTTSQALGAELKARCAAAGVQLHEFGRASGPSPRVLRAAWLLYKALGFRRRRWDVIYTNAQGCLSRIVWLAAGSDARVVHHHHTSADADERRTWSRCFRRLLRTAPELIACSHPTAAAIEAATGRRQITVLYYLTPMIPAILGVRAAAAQPILKFGFLGRLIPEKGIDTICRLSEDPALSDVEWHIHGEGTAYPARFFDRYPRVVYHGRYVGASDLAGLLSDLDALVLLSSHSEGLPLALMEGMAAGLPWIASNRGGTAELAYAPENCRLVGSLDDFDAIRDQVLSLAGAIRRGETSRVTQRAAYDAHLAYPIVSNHWLSFFSGR